MHVFLDENETYKSVASDILQVKDVDNYKKYIRHMFEEKFHLYLDRKDDNVNEDNEDNFEIKISKKICFYPPCLNYISNDKKYCLIHK